MKEPPGVNLIGQRLLASIELWGIALLLRFLGV